MTLDPTRALFPAPLQGLSLSKDVRVPTPQERMAALHQYVETQFADVMLAERIRGNEYARQETLDGAYPTTDTYGA